MNIRKLPKVELHLHHEGAAPPSFIRQLAFEKKIDLSNIYLVLKAIITFQISTNF